MILNIFAVISVMGASSQADIDIVYVRVPRTTETIHYQHRDTNLPAARNWDLLDSLPETSSRIADISGPGQLVHLDAAGDERVLYDCMNERPACVPMDPTVSFDGGRVIFSVLQGQLERKTHYGNELPNDQLTETTGARLYVADIATGDLTALPHVPGVFDTGPVFLPDGNIMFTSTRSNELRSSNFYYTPSDEPVLQLWIADGNGENARRVGPHDRDGSLHPFVMTDGRVVFSTWQISHNNPHRSNNGNPGTPNARDNHFWIASVDHTGGHWNAVFGKHGKNYVDETGREQSTKALHFLAQLSNGHLCTTDYYRANNFGAGQIVCWQREGVGIEGRGPDEEIDPDLVFTPRRMYRATTWGSSSDKPSSRVDGEYTGKPRDPVGLPDGQLAMAVARGLCSRHQGIDTVLRNQHEPLGCDVGIYMTTRVPSEHPDDLQRIVDRPEWHEFMPRVAEPYESVYGIEKPETPQIRRDEHGRCILATSSMEPEVQPSRDYKFNSAVPCAKQGCKSHHVPITSVVALRFWQVLPNTDWRVQRDRLLSTIGNRLALMGEIPVFPDRSFAVDLPCDTPFLLAGVDKDGHVILRDQIPQSLRPGEVRVCGGCHLHSRQGVPIGGTMAEILMDLRRVPQLGVGFVHQIKNGRFSSIESEPILYEYQNDIWPILETRCAGCHSGGLIAGGGLPLNIPGTDTDAVSNPSTWYRIAWDYKQRFVANQLVDSDGRKIKLEKPYASLYINNAFAIESLLYWKAANERLDRRTDDQYEEDIDFGADHPTDITPQELTVLRNWIEAGAYADTVKH